MVDVRFTVSGQHAANPAIAPHFHVENQRRRLANTDR